MDEIARLEKILYPVTRVRSGSGAGSGTVVWSGNTPEGKTETYVLTNHHVVKNQIKVEKRWDPNIKKELMVETRSSVEVEFFQYENGSTLEGTTSYKAEIVAYSKEEDLALLRLKKSTPTYFVADLAPESREAEIFLGNRIVAVGCALSHEPIMTDGGVNFMDEEIDNKIYWMGSAPIIFGNSGGAVFLAKTGEFIGVPSRGAVIPIGFSANTVPHMNWFIPFSRIYGWLETIHYNFICDPEVTYEQAMTARDRFMEEFAGPSFPFEETLAIEDDRPAGKYY